ncbi:hypothetical protein GCM10010964_32130 [Caldovatus sediminis]|uniref:Lipoprotein n=1 Tax=Caldovatus sediminis TaxID=2041189 RepID=A0A8J2ZDV2_9PROT|nr:hypothetical protein [Caldovatus sediminis]GGG42212.1 hypothetical protein GCM10010964_32130 [Caldovatus sediminis]
MPRPCPPRLSPRTVAPLVASALAAVVAAGCAGPPRTWAYACPRPGSTVTYDDGRTLSFARAAPDSPAVCIAEGPGGGEVRLIHAIIPESAIEGRGHAEGMAPLWPAKANNTANYRSVVRSEGSGIQYDFDANWRVVGFEMVQVPAGRFDAVVLERRWSQRSGGDLNAVIRYWIDTDAGIPVKRTVETIRGTTLMGPWQATRAVLPPPPPPPPRPPNM